MIKAVLQRDGSWIPQIYYKNIWVYVPDQSFNSELDALHYAEAIQLKNFCN